MISAGILSYYAPKTLRHTLETYKTSGFFELIDDLFVVIQKSDRQVQEIEVCNEFGLRYIALSDNGLMASGFKAIYENAKYDLIMFLENDFCTYCSNNDIKNYITTAKYFIESGQSDIVRGRSRSNPGDPNFAYMNLRNIPPENFINNTHLSECIYWVEKPEELYSTKISKVEPKEPGQDWYITTSRHCNWTNNPFICSKEFFKNAVYPYLEFNTNIEKMLTGIWAKANYKCIFGFGIFTHDRSFDGHK
jgi:hypothetical protein